MFIMGIKLSYVMTVKIGLMKKVQVLQYINILGSQKIVMKLGEKNLMKLNVGL